VIRRLLTVLFPSTPTCQTCAGFAGRGYCTNAKSPRYGHTVTPRDGCAQYKPSPKPTCDRCAHFSATVAPDDPGERGHGYCLNRASSAFGMAVPPKARCAAFDPTP
jgi:hypothetical protein